MARGRGGGVTFDGTVMTAESAGSMWDVYEERRERFDTARRREEALGSRLGWARLSVFLTGFAFYVGMDVAEGVWATGFAIGLAAAVLAFLILMVRHRRVRARERRFAALAGINARALARLDRDWHALPPTLFPPPDPGHAYAGDLDIHGAGSLLALFTTVTLPPGVETLRGWLLAPAAPEEIRARQEAVEELAGKLELRESLELEGRIGDPPPVGALWNFLEWARGEDWLSRRGWLRWMGWLAPAFNAALFLLWLLGFLAGPWWLLSLLGAMALGYTVQPRIHAILGEVSEGHERLARYAAALAILRDAPFEASRLRDLQDRIGTGAADAVEELRRLGRRVAWADVRLSSTAHAILQALVLWDVHVLASLEDWRRRSGAHVQDWIEALGRFEGLAAIAALRGDHPEWCFPEIREDGPPGMTGKSLGHPLIPPASCVGNDVDVGPPGTFLFVTGSNMSGKSTLLRAMGLNVILAQAGAPVCAREMELTPLDVQTCMRTRDSVTEGVSQYMAELRRIQQVVSAAREKGTAGERRPVLFLLDEPLQGTNEAERRVAVQTILGHLLDAGALGAVATHDLGLDGTPRLAAAARATHFEGSVEEGGRGPLLSFDYRLRGGRATSTNALALLRAVGLGGPGE